MERAKKGNQAVRKRKQDLQDEEDNILQEALELIEKLFEARLIERIARPIDRRVR